jgi:multidrug resistance protein, MATE family
MLTNVATALFGVADMWVIGRLGDASAQGAVELGAKLLMAMIVFNFLRTGTVALTAQASGSGNANEQSAVLARSLAVAAVLGLALLAAKPWVIDTGLALLEANGEIERQARIYIGIRYWVMPAWLANAVLVGWLIGQRRVRPVLAVEIGANAIHIGLDVLLVLGFGWGVAGVAAATACSELLKLGMLAILVARSPASQSAMASLTEASTWRGSALARLFAMNRDLFVRTLLLTAAIMLFARSGAQQGPTILAANGILFQLFMLSTLLLDGFESSSQVLCGEARGADDRERFSQTVRATLMWGMVTGLAISAVYLVAGRLFAASFSTDPQVAAAATRYAWWVALLPILGVVSFVLDGVFVGAGWTRAMLVTMAMALAVYCGTIFGLAPLANDMLWFAFALMFVVRTAGQLAMMPRLTRDSFRPS